MSTTTVAPPAPPLSLVQLNAAVARHFTPEELRAASEWQGEHPEIPAVKDGPTVYRDPITKKIHAELRRITEQRRRAVPNNPNVEGGEPTDAHPEESAETLSAADYEALIDLAAESFSTEILARIEDASVAHHEQEQEEPTIEHFMAGTDEHLEPYLAFRDGMSLKRIATTYGIANVRLLLDKIEQGLGKLEDKEPEFNRAAFLGKAKRAVEIRCRDARIGTERAAAEREALMKPRGEEESTVKRGAEWASVDSIPRVVIQPAKRVPKGICLERPASATVPQGLEFATRRAS